MRPLESLRIAKPCAASWDGMAGDHEVRHCGQCDRKVYNLSGMTREEAEALVSNTETGMCVRFVRKDGMVMTQDCGEPVHTRKNFGLALAAIPLIAALSASPSRDNYLAKGGATPIPAKSGPALTTSAPTESFMGFISARTPPPAPKTGFSKMLATFERWGSKARHLVFK